MAAEISPNMSLRRFNCIFVFAGTFFHTFGFAYHDWITYTIEIPNESDIVIPIGLWQLCLKQEPLLRLTCGSINDNAIGGESVA